MKVSQGYKTIKATLGGQMDRFLKATRLPRLQEGDARIGFSRLQGYQGYWKGCRDKFLNFQLPFFQLNNYTLIMYIRGKRGLTIAQTCRY